MYDNKKLRYFRRIICRGCYLQYILLYIMPSLGTVENNNRSSKQLISTKLLKVTFGFVFIAEVLNFFFFN